MVNHTLYTDIVAVIDGHPLRSYNVDNYTVVVAEDLRAYGFQVIWHGQARRLEVLRPLKNGEWQTPASYPDYTPSVPAGKIGTPARDILATDIVTTVGGDEVQSWNIGGETCIRFRELERYGKMDYNHPERRSSFTTVPYAELTGDTGAGLNALELGLGSWDAIYSAKDGVLKASFTAGEEPSVTTFLARGMGDVNFDLFWTVSAAPDAVVTLAFFPGQFPEAAESLKHIRRRAYDALCALPVPSMPDTPDGTNTPEVRSAVAEVFRVTLNGKTVTGDLFKRQGNGREDFVFLFDKGFEIRPGDEIGIVIEAKP